MVGCMLIGLGIYRLTEFSLTQAGLSVGSKVGGSAVAVTFDADAMSVP